MSDNPAPNARFRMSVTQSRMQFRVDATLERADGDEQAAITGPGVGISYLLAKEIVASLKIGIAEIERLEAEIAKLTERKGRTMRDIPQMKTIEDRLRYTGGVIEMRRHGNTIDYYHDGKRLNAQIVCDMLRDGWLIEGDSSLWLAEG